MSHGDEQPPAVGPGSTSDGLVRFGVVRAVLAAFAVQLVANAVVLAAAEPAAQGLRIRGLHQLYQAGRQLGAALVVVLVLLVCRRFRLHRGRRGYATLGLVAFALASVTLVDDLTSFAGNLLPAAPQLALWGLVVTAAGGVVAAAFVGRKLARPRLRWLAVLVGAAVLAAHPGALGTGYPGAHLFAAAAALALIAGALTSAALPRRWPQLVAALPWALVAALSAFTLVVPPSNSLQLQMLQQEGDVVTPFLSRLASLVAGSEGALPGKPGVPKEWGPWVVAREGAAGVPASSPPLLARPIVLLLTIDSLRADIIDSKQYDADLPNLARLRDSSLHFTMARAPGSQTVYTIAEMFMGTYFSQQYWSSHPGIRDLWPDDDDTTRFPALLTAAGVTTVNLATAVWLDGDTGMARGFADDRFIEPVKTRYTLSDQTFPALIERLETVGDAPFFAYTHMLDAHFTVSPLDPKAPAKQRYVTNLGLVDASIGSLTAALERLGLAERTILIISADHGEAFGEHNTHHHRDTLYEELLRVPFMIHGPGIKPREVDTPVSVMDIGPTVLDLFGVETPGHFMGQSLVGFLRGERPKLTRPIAAEGRLKKALIFPDGMKAIVDDRHGTSEVYNLKADPGETSNLVDADDPRAAERISALRSFFGAHKIRRAGYTPPFRP